MKGVLSNRLTLLSEAVEPELRVRLLAALRIGATMALARISELGGSYPSGSDFKAVMTELDGDTTRIEPEVTAPVDPPPDNPF